jgi:peptidoglycan/LPS O-acetylase OafA/YrhL
MQTNREAGADLVRAVACLMVICHHLLQRLDPSGLPHGVKDAVAFGLTGSFGVAAFFVLSGYLLSRPFWRAALAGGEMPPLKVFALRRAARIAPAFWLSLTVSFLVGVTLLGKRFSDFNLMRYGAGFLFLGGWHWSTLFPVDDNGPLWSIGLEVASYLFLALCMVGLFRSGVGGRKSLLAWLAVIVAVLAVDWLVVSYWPVDQTGAGWDHGLLGGAKAWMPRYSPVSLFAIFAIGVLAGGIRCALPERPHGLADLAALFGFGLAIAAMASAMYGPTEGFSVLGIPYRYPWFPAGVAIALVAMPQSLWLGRLADNQLVAFIARISFGLYLWHFLVLEVMGALWLPGASRGGMTDLGQWLLVCVTAIVASTAIATTSFYVLEQPIIRWARTLERRPRPPAVAVAEGA